MTARELEQEIRWISTKSLCSAAEAQLKYSEYSLRWQMVEREQSLHLNVLILFSKARENKRSANDEEGDHRKASWEMRSILILLLKVSGQCMLGNNSSCLIL